MRILLIYPEYLVTDGDAYNLPLGLLHIGSWIESKGHQVTLLDCAVEGDWKKRLDQLLPETDLIGISAMTVHLPSVEAILDYSRKERGFEGPVVLGGVHGTLFPEQTIQSGWFDYVITGEGELPFLELINALESQQDPSSILGVGYLAEAGPVVNAPNKDFNYSEMPHINYRLLGTKMIDFFQGSSIGVLSSRGCPFKCSFCINSAIEGSNKWRSWDAERTADEIEYVIREYGANTVWFWDEHFFVSKKRVTELLDAIEARNLKFSWAAEIRADTFRRILDEELLQRLKDSGCIKLAMGAESASEKMLKIYNKRIKSDDVYSAAQRCIDVGIQPTFSFIIGAPGEERDDVAQTLEMFRKLMRIDTGVRILGPQIFRPYPGSPLYDKCAEAGLTMPATVQEWIISVQRDMTENNPYISPWIKDPDFVNTIWFYSFLISTDLSVLRALFLEYCEKTSKAWPFRFAGQLGIQGIALLGRFRYKFGLYRFQIEINLFKKYRAVLSF
ncbi:MAG: radical SAM protein [bacterium]|nr:radical SAM protein [bacterium]